MYQEFTREMNDRERAILDQCMVDPQCTLLGSLARAFAWMTGWFACLAFVGLTNPFADAPAITIPPVMAGIVGFQMIIVGTICFFRAIASIGYYLLGGEDWLGTNKRIRKVLADGRVHVKSIRATAVIQIKADCCHADASAYIFRVGENQVFRLMDFSLHDESEPWPNSHFEIVQIVMGGDPMGTFCYGEKLKPERVLGLTDCRDEIAEAFLEDFIDWEDAIERDFTEYTRSLVKPSGNADGDEIKRPT